DRFADALRWAAAGRWASAASAFETLTDDPALGPLADRNLGYCRLWLADDLGALGALRRHRVTLGYTPEAVDLEGLCQLLETDPPSSQVEHVRLTWPLRDRDALLARLAADKTVADDGETSLDPANPEAPAAQEFLLLDRPNAFDDNQPLPDGGDGLAIDAIPEIVGRVLVTSDSAILETYDDGRLDGLSDRLRDLAGTSIAPAHPRTKVVGRVPKRQLALIWEWRLPEGLSPANQERLTRDKGLALIDSRWPDLPLPSLRGRSPRQAAAAGDAEIPLRAAVRLLEIAPEAWARSYDFPALRQRLNLPEEPPIDPETVDPRTVHLSRLGAIPAEALSDDKLVALFRRAHETFHTVAIERAGRLLLDRPAALESHGLPPILVYMDLVTIASREGRVDEALALLARGRQADPPAHRAPNAVRWDLYELRVRATHQEPEQWVPELAAVLDRYGENPESMRLVMVHLVELGLVELVQRSDDPEDVFLDTRALQAVLSRYGPRVTTASGRLGVSAAKPEIWTPASATPAAGGGAIWTPGQGASPSESAPKKLIY
ncbi:MAG: hypothetical protein K2X91_13450, partial [Thermoleophilia bacterium]|nr:hypothetical protein [Thermoleophilia bacterium]